MKGGAIMLICIEGITNSGKTTTCLKLCENKNFFFINGKMKKDIVLSNISKITHPLENVGMFDYKTELLLYLTILSQKARFVEEMLNLDKTLLVDRYTLSIYSYFLVEYGLSKELLENYINFASRNIKPDITFFLDVSLETILKRAENSPLSRKDINLKENYNELRKIYLKKLPLVSKDYIIIEGDKLKPEEIVHKIVKSL
jgi:dTMP kinase